MPQSISMKGHAQKSFLGDALGDAGAWLGRKAGQGIGGLFGLKKGGKVMTAKKGGKAPHMVKGSKAAKEKMKMVRMAKRK